MKALYEFKSRFDPSYVEYLKICIDGIVAHHPDFLSVGEHLLKLAGGGKRLRPFVLDLSYRASGGKDISLIKHSMFALELFQLFALIHDDIMDGDTLRHGVETMHIRFDLSQAILAGDLCLVWAMRAIGLDPKAASKERSIFLQLAEETMIGQMIDTSVGLPAAASLADKERLSVAISLKTSKYTFIYPSLLGLSFAGDLTFQVEYTEFGEHLGQAFQRLNDLSDIMATEAVLGKKPGSDITADVSTHLSQYFDEHATNGQKAIYAVYRGQPIDHNDLARVRELFVVSGAVDNERKAIEKELSIAESILLTMTMSSQFKETWSELISFFRLQLANMF